MRNLCALLTVGLLNLAPTLAEAAPVTLNFSGSTISTITDGTNFFGLGSSIATGTGYSFNVTYEEAEGLTGIVIAPGNPILGFQGHSYCCGTTQDFIDFGPGPNHISLVELVLNGVKLSVPTQQFESFDSRTRRLSSSCCGIAIDERFASMSGTGSNGNSLSFTFDYRFRLSLQKPIDETFSTSLAIQLLATDGSSLVDFTANNAFGMQAQSNSGQDVPIPAALPLLVAGLAGLGVAARHKRG